MRGTCNPHLIRSENSFARVGVIHMIIQRTEQETEKCTFTSSISVTKRIIGEEEGGEERWINRQMINK